MDSLQSVTEHAADPVQGYGTYPNHQQPKGTQYNPRACDLQRKLDGKNCSSVIEEVNRLRVGIPVR
jgi:hypothetical protein